MFDWLNKRLKVRVWVVALSATAFLGQMFGQISVATVDELDRVVVLCATQPYSSAFAHAWQAWVSGHPDADIVAVASEVVRRAATIRSFAQGAGKASSERLTDGKIHARMTELARQAMSVTPRQAEVGSIPQ